MPRTRSLAFLSFALASGAAFAQPADAVATTAPAGAVGAFDGPAPLAWRWQGFSRTLSGGSPLVQGDRILTALGNRIYALDRTNGNQIWRFPTADPIEGNFRSSPLLVDGVLVAVADNRNVYGVDPDSGALKWVYQAPLSITGNPVVTANGKSVAFVLEGNKLLQLVTAATGEAAYSAPLLVKDGIAGQIAGYGDAIIYFSRTGVLTSLAANTQKPIWTRRFTSLPALPQPIVAGETLYSYSGQYLVALNAAGGTPRFQARLVEQPFSAPVVGVSGALVLTSAGKAYYYDNSGTLKTPKPIELGSQPIVPGTAVGTKFLVPTANGALNLIDPLKSVIDWSFIVRPSTPDAATTNPADGGQGGRPGFGDGGDGGAPGGGARGGQGGGRGGQGGIGRTDTAPTALLSIQASAPVAFAGSTLLVPARDGSLLAFDREFGVDLTPPEVRLAWPTPGEDVNGQSPLEMIFKIEDEASGLKLSTLALDIDGTPYETQFTKEGFLVARITSGGKNKALANGRHTLVVTAQDWLGNETKRSFALNVDNTLKPLVRPTTTDPNNPNGGPGGAGRPGGMGGGGFGGGPGL